MLLRDVPLGARVVVVAVGAPPAARTRRLGELGLRAGARVTVLRRTAGGGRLVAIGDDRVALGAPLLGDLEVEAEGA